MKHAWNATITIGKCSNTSVQSLKEKHPDVKRYNKKDVYSLKYTE